jgi:hypothetical protein
VESETSHACIIPMNLSPTCVSTPRLTPYNYSNRYSLLPLAQPSPLPLRRGAKGAECGLSTFFLHETRENSENSDPSLDGWYASMQSSSSSSRHTPPPYLGGTGRQALDVLPQIRKRHYLPKINSQAKQIPSPPNLATFQPPPASSLAKINQQIPPATQHAHNIHRALVHRQP